MMNLYERTKLKANKVGRRFFLAFALFFLLLNLTSSAFSSDENLNNPVKKIKLQWDFLKNKTPLDYFIHQTMRAQIEKMPENSQMWKKSPERKDTVLGNCVLTPAGDGNASGYAILRIDDVKLNGKNQTIPEHQLLPQLAAQFVLRPTGFFENYMGGEMKETYLILRLIFGLPLSPLQLHEGIRSPLKLISKKETMDLKMKGIITYELVSVAMEKDIAVSQISCLIDLREEMPDQSQEGTTIWKGKGELKFAVEQGLLQSSKWQIAKKTETFSGEKNTPTRIIEIYDIDVHLSDNNHSEITLPQ